MEREVKLEEQYWKSIGLVLVQMDVLELLLFSDKLIVDIKGLEI